ncbi:hypothetical protein Tco_0122124 [Tanacetum coccineum]
MFNYNRIYVTTSRTKKIFGNMKRAGKGFFGRVTPLFPTMVVHNQEEMGKGSAIPTDPHHTPTIIQPLTYQPQKTQKPRRLKRKDTEVPQPSGPITNVADEAVDEEMDASLERAATTATSLDAKQDSGNINKTKYKATLNKPSSIRTSSGSGPRRQETMGDIISQTRFENVSKLSNDPLLARGNTLQSGKDSLKLQELMELCTNLQQRVLSLEQTKTTQAEEIVSLKRRVKKLEQKKRLRTHGFKILYKVGSSRRVESSDEEGLGEEDASKQERIADIDADAGITLASTHFDADTNMFGVPDLDGDEVNVDNVDVVKTAEETINAAATTVSTASTILVSAATITDVEITLAQALAELKSTKPKAKRIVIHEHVQAPTPTVSSQQPSNMFGVPDLDGDEVNVDNVDVVKTAKETINAAATTVSTASTILVSAATITDVEITLAQALAELKSTKPKAKRIVIHEHVQAPTPTVSSQQPSQVNVQDNGKGKMVKPEPVKKMSRKIYSGLMKNLTSSYKLKKKKKKGLPEKKFNKLKKST